MTGTIWELALAAAFLLLTHFGLSSTPLRQVLVDRIGEGPYRGLYSLIAVVALAWLILAYGAAPHVPLWAWAPWQNYVPLVIMPVALLLVVGGLTVRNPTAVGQDDALQEDEAVRGLLRITRHPFLWGAGLWGLAHLVPNGDLASMIFFGTLATLGILGAALIDAKRRGLGGADWRRFERASSFIPFAAIAAGRQSLGRAAAEFGAVRLLVVVVLYGALLHAHPWLFGAPAIPPG